MYRRNNLIQIPEFSPANLGKLITDQIEIAAKEKMKGSMLGFLGGNAIISSFTSAINKKLDEYIESNGQNIISEMVNKEITKYTLKSVGDISTFLNTSELDFDSILISIYEKIILLCFVRYTDLLVDGLQQGR